MAETVSDERISYVLERLEIRWPFMGPDEIESVLRELQGYRAAEREQAAPKEPTGAWAVKSQLEDEFDGERWRFTVEKWEAHHDEPDGDCSVRV